MIRGRAWIPLLGVLLAGSVAMQVEVLKLGAGIGRSFERSTALQSRNELLQASVAALADDQRIERLAAGMGMVMPAPDAVSFLTAKPIGNGQQVVAGIHQPDALAFTAQLSSGGTPAGAATVTTTPVVSADPSASTTATAGVSASASSSGGAATPTGG